MATLSDRSRSLQDGTIVSSDLLSSQKGTPLLVHPMLQPNIGSPRDAATLREIGSVFPATQVLIISISVSLFIDSIGGGAGTNVPPFKRSQVAKL